MGEGETRIEGYLDAADTRSTLAAVAALGARVEEGRGRSGGELRIAGVGLRGAAAGGDRRRQRGDAAAAAAGLAGRAARRASGRSTATTRSAAARSTGSPMPLRQMGADVAARDGRPAAAERRGAPLRGIDYEMPVASAQVKCCLLFAGLLAEGETRVVRATASRDHTERMLAAAGASIERAAGAVVVRPPSACEPRRIDVPADFSSAAFFIVAAAIVPGSEVVLERVGLNPTRTGLLTDPRADGRRRSRSTATASTAASRWRAWSVRSAPLQATEVGGDEVPLAIDELPLVALAACFAEGTTTIRDAEELRRKESDRIETVTAALRALGGKVEATADGMVIEGTGGLRGGTISSHGDHRIAMLGAVAGPASTDGVEVEGMDAAAVSYPGFEADLRSLLGRRCATRPRAAPRAAIRTLPPW